MKRIEGDELKKLIDERRQLVIIDARGHEAYDKEHIPEALSIPSDHLGRDISKSYGKDTTFVTYCTDLECTAISVAANKLEKYGYTNVLEYKAGIEDWKTRGYPTVKKTR